MTDVNTNWHNVKLYMCRLSYRRGFYEISRPRPYTCPSINFTKMPFQQQYHGLDSCSDSKEIETFDDDMAIIVMSRAQNP